MSKKEPEELAGRSMGAVRKSNLSTGVDDAGGG